MLTNVRLSLCYALDDAADLAWRLDLFSLSGALTYVAHRLNPMPPIDWMQKGDHPPMEAPHHFVTW